MTTTEHIQADPVKARELERIYRLRFDGHAAFRADTWRVLVNDFFQNLVGPAETILDLGCGYGEFINLIACRKKFAMDLNTAAGPRLASDVTFLHQDCSAPWQLDAECLDVVFSSNFLEHLPSKTHVDTTLARALAALKPGGRLILMGPNIRYSASVYWDFWDHHVPLSHVSLTEALRNVGFEVDRVWPKFLPYAMVGCYPGLRRVTTIALRVYLRCPPIWPLVGKQFLVVARKP